jgi:hypothetical protein
MYGIKGLNLEEAGEIVQDKFGLETGSCVYTARKSGALARRPRLGTRHPYADYLKLVRVRTVLTPIARFICDYEGCDSSTNELNSSIYELEVGVSEEPIQSHKWFFSDLAGSPAEPRNGAQFTDDEGSFSHFSSLVITGFSPGVVHYDRNPMAGVESFLDGGRAVWSQTYTTANRPYDHGEVGRVMTPPGPIPDFGQRTWLYIGMNMTIRGSAYCVRREWQLSGENGWITNPPVYQWA